MTLALRLEYSTFQYRGHSLIQRQGTKLDPKFTDDCAAVLRNDQQSLTEQLDNKLQEYFSEVSSKPKQQSAAAANNASDQSRTSRGLHFAEASALPPEQPNPSRPFAIGMLFMVDSSYACKAAMPYASGQRGKTA